MRTGLAILLGGLLCLAGPALGFGPASAAGQAADPDAIRIGLPLQPTNALTIVAVSNKYFADEGLRAAVTEYPSGRIALAKGLFAGAADVVVASDVPIALSGFDRNDFKIVATVYAVDNQNRVVARKDRGIAAPIDLRGKRIATQGGSAVHFFLSLFLASNGILGSQVEQSFMAPQRMPAALVSGAIDAFAMREPFVSRATMLLGGNVVVFEAPGLYDQTDQIVVSDALLDKRPDTVVRILRALIRAEEYVRADLAGAQRIIAERVGIAAATIAADWPRRPPRVTLDQSLLPRLEAQARWAIRNKLVKGDTVPNYLEVIHLRSLATVRPRAVTVVR